MRVSIPDWRREPPPESRAGVPELTFHLRLDVERLLPAPHAALVTGDHELAHLVPERVVRALWTGERGQLRVDVERRLPAALTPRRLASSSWRISASASARPAAESGGGPLVPGSRSSAKSP